MPVTMTARNQRDTPDLSYVYGAPGHLMRRSHQIAVALFFEELRGFKITPPQYASLVAVMDQPGIDQRRLADLVAIDRSTIGTLLQRLEKKGLIRRLTPAADQRVKQLFITSPGRDLLARSHKAIQRSQERILAPLTLRERRVFLRILARLVHINNEVSRVPLRARGGRAPAGAAVDRARPKLKSS
jgi:MarR family transcriptional regulator, lower aerobic nicotinate degradation pathway regulator